MSNIHFSTRAYGKMLLHAAKYPHLAVNGLLLSEGGNDCEISDAIPLFHQCLHVSPMFEIALIQVEAWAAQQAQQIVGYYAGSEHFYDNSIEKAPRFHVADKIAKNVPNVCFAMVDNVALNHTTHFPALRTWQHRKLTDWNKVKYTVENARYTFDAVSILLQRGVMKKLYDFDNYLDNTDHDYHNALVNEILDQI